MFCLTKYFLLSFLTVLLGGCLAGNDGTSSRVVLHNEQAMLDISFTDHDRELLRYHYGYMHPSKHKKMPPGLARKNKLPPGIQKQLVRNGRLPEGLSYRRLPLELERKLSRIPEGYIRVIVNDSFVLFNQRTRVIFDIIHEL